MANRKNYSKISTEGAKAKQTDETKIESSIEPTDKVESTPKTLKGVVDNCERLNVRTNPSLNAAVESVIDKGTEVEITDSYEDFYFVRTDKTTKGINGWCMKKYIRVDK